MSNEALFRRVLIVTSSYSPTTIADLHRARHLAWELPELGWTVEILCPNREFQREEYFELNSESFFSPTTVVHAVAPVANRLFHLLKVGGIGWRSLLPIYRKGSELLKTGRFDVVYFSTANFVLFTLGAFWRKKYTIPYVLDFHDPWVRVSTKYRTTKHPIKQWIGSFLSKTMERRSVENAAGVVSVSPIYISHLRKRYTASASLRANRSMAIPFAARRQDLEIQSTGSKHSNHFLINYVGAGGSIMAKSFSAICASLAELRKSDPAPFQRLRIRLYGTYAYWKPGDPTPLRDIATTFGLDDVVEEYPARVTYRRSLELILESDGLFVLGVDDQGYMPSKLFPYALSGKPLLGSFRSDSPPVDYFARLPELGHLLTFPAVGPTPKPGQEDIATVGKFLKEASCRTQFDRLKILEPYLAPAMARRHADLFDQIVASCELRALSALATLRS